MNFTGECVPFAADSPPVSRVYVVLPETLSSSGVVGGSAFGLSAGFLSSAIPISPAVVRIVTTRT